MTRPRITRPPIIMAMARRSAGPLIAAEGMSVTSAQVAFNPAKGTGLTRRSIGSFLRSRRPSRRVALPLLMTARTSSARPSA
ncbi:hypothetical protein D3C87_1725450 [compost metagenome]